MKFPPLAHQIAARAKAKDFGHKEYFAYFMEQGTGKTYTQLWEAEELFEADLIDLMIIIAPSGVQTNWLQREIPKLLSIPYETLLWQPNHTKTWTREASSFANRPSSTTYKWLRIMAFNVEAFSQKQSKAEIFLRAIIKKFNNRVLLSIDESSTIKNLTKTARTRHIVSIGRLLEKLDKEGYKRILTGTPATQSPFNFYAQAHFLRAGLLGFTLYTPFKAYYGEWIEKTIHNPNPTPKNPGTTRKYPELVRYRNLGILKAAVDRFSYTVTKAECLDLPPKVYEQRFCEMTDHQQHLYTECLTRLVLQVNSDQSMTLAHAFTRLTRLSQICGGFYKADDTSAAQPIDGRNTKIESILQYAEELAPDKKIIIWARYLEELRAIAKALGRSRCALYWGDYDKVERNDSIDRFTDDADCRYFVGNTRTGKFGFTLNASSHVLYYSNDYSADARWQSEDRNHRIGQTESVTYTDLVYPGTVDQKLLSILATRKSMADFFKGDKEAMIRWLTEQPAPTVVDPIWEEAFAIDEEMYRDAT